MSFEIRSFNESISGAMEGPDDGVYAAVVVEVEDPEFYAFPEPGLTPEQLEAKKKWVTRFTFEIENDAEWNGYKLRTKRINFTTLHEKSKNYELWRALTGEGFDPDHKYRPSEAKGHRCQLVVKTNKNGYSDIDGFLPAKRARQNGGTRTVNQMVGEAPTEYEDVDSVPF